MGKTGRSVCASFNYKGVLMSKTKQILAILFPRGIFFTYIPSFLCLFAACNVIYIANGNWSLFAGCLSLALSFRIFYTVYLWRKARFADEALTTAVFDTVRPQLEALYNEALQNMNGFDPEVFFGLQEQSYKIIDAEFERRKSLAEVSKTGKP
jgi:hypothetical protein